MIKNAVRITVILLCLSLLCGCWNRRELNELGVVVGVGLDKGDVGGDINVIIQFENTAASAGGSEGGGREGGQGEVKAYLNVLNRGTDVFSIIRDYNSMVTRNLYFPHNQVIVVGEELAKAGIAPYLDFFLRDSECRMTVHLMVAKGTAEQALSAKPLLEKVPSIDLAGTVKNQARYTAETPDVNLFDFFVARISPGLVPITPLITLEDTGNSVTASVAGGAVFLDGRMVGELNGTEMRGVNWVLGRAKNSVINLETSDGSATLEITNLKSKVSPSINENGKPKISININVTAGLGSQSGRVNQGMVTTIPYLENKLNEIIRAESLLAIAKAQELRSDFFGFGQKFARYLPDDWDNMNDNWLVLLNELEVEFTVRARITGTGKLTKPVYVINPLVY